MQEVPVVIDSKFIADAFQIDTSIVDDLMNSANSEVSIILEKAKRAAESCLNEAIQQVEPIKQRAYDEGHQHGYQEGYQEGIIQGKQAGVAEMQQVIDQAIAKTQQILDAGKQETKNMILAAEEQIIEIALAVARKILAYEISENPMVVLPLVKTALQKVSDQDEVVIRVSMDDFEAVLLAKKELQTIVGRENALEIIVDSTIASGSCVIDTSYGTVDARVDTQFENIKKALNGVA